jgi:hypothetical protein
LSFLVASSYDKPNDACNKAATFWHIPKKYANIFGGTGQILMFACRNIRNAGWVAVKRGGGCPACRE